MSTDAENIERILARILARELTTEELEHVTGAIMTKPGPKPDGYFTCTYTQPTENYDCNDTQ